MCRAGAWGRRRAQGMSGAEQKPSVLWLERRHSGIHSATALLCSVHAHRPALARLGKFSGKASEILKGSRQEI